MINITKFEGILLVISPIAIMIGIMLDYKYSGGSRNEKRNKK